MVEKIKEKRPAPHKAKEKIQSAPKELLRRGLLDGSEKLRGQLRDAAERGQREEDISDRAHGFATQGARLAVDRLGRMRLGKKKGIEQSSGTPPKPASSSSDRSEPPAPATERVQIKTRGAVRDAPAKVYGEGGQPKRAMSAQSSVKTKDAYIHRQVEVYGEVRQKTSPASERTPQTPEHTAPANSTRSVQQTVKTKESFIRRQASGWDRRSAGPAPISRSIPIQPEASQTLEQGKQKFIRERAQKTAVQRIEGRGFESASPVPTERYEIIESPVSSSRQTSSEPVRRAANTPLSKQKINERDTAGGKFSIKEARSNQSAIKRPTRKTVKMAADSPRQAVKTAEYSGRAAQQITHATQQTTSAVQHTARVAQQTARAASQAPRRAVQAQVRRNERRRL